MISNSTADTAAQLVTRAAELYYESVKPHAEHGYDKWDELEPDVRHRFLNEATQELNNKPAAPTQDAAYYQAVAVQETARATKAEDELRALRLELDTARQEIASNDAAQSVSHKAVQHRDAEIDELRAMLVLRDSELDSARDMIAYLKASCSTLDKRVGEIGQEAEAERRVVHQLTMESSAARALNTRLYNALYGLSARLRQSPSLAGLWPEALSEAGFAEDQYRLPFITLIARAENEAEDAARWRGLINCARIKLFGSAGLDSDKDMYGHPHGNYAHIGMELWTVHTVGSEPGAARYLTKFADKAVAAHKDRK